MARFPLSSISPNYQIVLAGLVLIALASLMFLRQVYQVSASPGNTNLPGVKLPAAHSQISEESSANPEGPSDSGQAANSSQTSLNVNGQNIPLPQNGVVNQTLTNQDGTTTTIQAQHSENSSSSTSQGQASNTSNSDVNISVSSNSGGSQ